MLCKIKIAEILLTAAELPTSAVSNRVSLLRAVAAVGVQGCISRVAWVQH